jgi:hypothetical protein
MACPTFGEHKDYVFPNSGAGQFDKADDRPVGDAASDVSPPPMSLFPALLPAHSLTREDGIADLEPDLCRI